MSLLEFPGFYHERRPSLAEQSWQFMASSDDWAPRVARFDLPPLIGDMIPASSWGVSLAKMARASSWKEMSDVCRDWSSSRCMLCGEKHAHLELHEVWSYEPPALGSLTGLQTLSSITLLCRRCHETQHLGLAAIQGNLARALARVCYLWGFSNKESCDLYEILLNRWQWRSTLKWEVQIPQKWLDAIPLRKGFEVNGAGVVKPLAA